MLIDVSMHRIRRRFFIFPKNALVVLRMTIISIVLVIIQRFYVNHARTRDRYLLIFYVSIWPSYIGSVMCLKHRCAAHVSSNGTIAKCSKTVLYLTMRSLVLIIESDECG